MINKEKSKIELISELNNLEKQFNRINPTSKTSPKFSLKFNEKYELEFISKSFCQLIGKSPKDLANAKITSFIYKKDWAVFKEYLSNYNLTYPIILRIIISDKKFIPAEWEISVNKNHNNGKTQYKALGKILTLNNPFKNIGKKLLIPSEDSKQNAEINSHNILNKKNFGSTETGEFNANMDYEIALLKNEVIQKNHVINVSLLNSMIELVIHLDVEHKILWANEAVTNSLKVSLNDIIGKHCYEVRFGTNERCSDCPVVKTFKTGKISSDELKSPDNKNWIVSGYPVFDAEGNNATAFEICLDITEKKKSEDAIIEGERRWQFALEATSDGVWDWDIQENTFNYFRRIKEKQGYFIEKAIFKYQDWKKLIHSDDVMHAESKLLKHLNGEISIYENEHRIKGKNGNYIWILDRGKIISWSVDGKPLRMLGTQRDITEKKVAEEQLRYQTKQMFVRQAVLLELAKLDKSNFESSIRKILKTDSKILNIERVSYWTFNEDKTELACTLLYNLNSDSYSAGLKLHIEQAPKYFAALNDDRVITSFSTYNDERMSELFEIYLKPNNIMSVLNFPVWVQDKMIGIVSHEQVGEIKEWTFEEQEFCNSIADMIALSIVTSDGAKAEKEIIKLSRAIEQSPASVVITDTLGNIEYVNPKFTSVTGYNFEEVIYRNPRLLKSGEMNPECYKELWQTISSGREWRGEFLNKKKNGQLFWESASISPIKNSKGEIINYLAVKEDITDKKFMDIELKRALDRAEESSKLKTSLLANMSHELRTPMNGILGFAQLLSEEITEPVQKQMLQKIQQSGNRLMRTLNTILDLTELESNEFLLSMTQLKIGNMLPYLLKEYEEKAKEKGLYWDYEIPDKNVLTFTDESVFKKIITNLADNALKFTEKGGIKIRMHKEKRDDEGILTKIHVIDSGIGIAEKNKELIFHEFRQASEGISRNFEGSGLGLTLARKMSRLLNGDILVESELGAGSDFTLVLPGTFEDDTLPDNQIQGPERIKTVEKIISTYPTEILLVEDNLINKEVVEVFLRGICKVEHAIDGEEAIRMTLKKKYALILMDINLGAGITGVDVVKEIRKIQGYETTPIVAITGYAMSGDKDKFLKQGMTHYISKPFDKQVLIRLINEIIYKQ